MLPVSSLHEQVMAEDCKDFASAVVMWFRGWRETGVDDVSCLLDVSAWPSDEREALEHRPQQCIISCYCGCTVAVFVVLDAGKEVPCCLLAFLLEQVCRMGLHNCVGSMLMFAC